MSGPAKKGFPQGNSGLEQTPAWYDNLYANETRLNGRYAKHWTECPHRTVTWYPALVLVRGTVLEIGCGPGHFAHMCRQFGIGYVLGIDYSRVAIAMASNLMRGLKPHRFKLADALSSPEIMKETEYETAVALEVLEHVVDDLAVIASVPEGKTFVGSVPSFHTEGHVRWFANAQQVKARYGPMLDIDVVITEKGLKSSNQWFIFRGVRR